MRSLIKQTQIKNTISPFKIPIDKNMNSNKNTQTSIPESIADAASELCKSIFEGASQATQNIAKTTAGVGMLLEDFAENSTRQAHQLLEQATTETGRKIQSAAQNPILKFLSNLWGAGWLKTLLGEIDTKQIEAKVKKLQQEYPLEKPSEIAHRVMVEKAWEGSKVGLITNIIPPIAVALFGIELAATTKMQAEMVYEIAAAYGLDLSDPARRGEVMAIFGLSLGGSSFKTGLSVIEIIPGVGPVVAASSNAMMLYALGFTACRFYEGKLNNTNGELTVSDFAKETDAQLLSAPEQLAIMDRILAQMILVSHPDKAWSDIAPALQIISPSAAKDMESHLENPEPLEELLERLEPELGMSVLAQCYRIASLDGVITTQERKFLEAIALKFDIDLDKAIANS